MGLQIKEDKVETVVHLSQQIPEFNGPPNAAEYNRRLTGLPHSILVAYLDEQPAAFKVGYERDGSFYSWMGAVLPAYRQKGLAKALADAQEAWAKNAGYSSITFKTRNQHKGMLIFALKNGFNIIGFKEKEILAHHRILLRKQLIEE